MKKWIVIGAVLAPLVFAGGQRLGFSTGPQTPEQVGDPNSVPKSTVKSGNEIYSRLTANTWCNAEDIKDFDSGFPPTSRSYTFRADGTYEYAHFSDVPEEFGEGKWNFQVTPYGGLIRLSSRDFISFYFAEDDALRLGHLMLRPCQPLNPGVAAMDALPDVDALEFLGKLSRERWVKTNESDLAFRPTGLEFSLDGVVIAEFRKGECTEVSLLSSRGDGSNHISLQPAPGTGNSCDLRSFGEERTRGYGGSANIRNDGLLQFLNTTYAPVSAPTEKAVIGSILGFSDVVNIEVRYDTPVRAGVPNRFNIVMTHIGEMDYPGPITLNRFSVTREFVRQYREPGNPIAPAPSELAGIDLADRVLKPGESYEFSLDVLFDTTGLQQYYINGFMYGRTQAWDTKRSYEFIVQ